MWPCLRPLVTAPYSSLPLLLAIVAAGVACTRDPLNPISDTQVSGGTESVGGGNTTGGSATTGGEPTTSGEPTTGDPCPGYNDVCIVFDETQTKTQFACEGFRSVKLDGTFDPLVPDKYKDELPIEQAGMFFSVPYDDPTVMACCSDEYLGGCGDKPAPQALSCQLDCAQQACLGVVALLDQTIANIDMVNNDGIAGNNVPVGVRNQYAAIRNCLFPDRIGECQYALYDRTDCPEMAAENGILPEEVDEWCSDLYTIRGRYTLPDLDDWGLVTNLHGDFECEINDFVYPEMGAIECNGILGNNLDPFGRKDELPLTAMRANIVNGAVALEGGGPVSVSGEAELVGKHIEFRTRPCDDGCAFKLDDLEFQMETFKLGFTKVKNARASLTWVATGARHGTDVEFGVGTIGLHVVADLESLNPLLNGVHVDEVALNYEPVTLEIDGDEVEITSASFDLQGLRLLLTTPPCTATLKD